MLKSLKNAIYYCVSEKKIFHSGLQPGTKIKHTHTHLRQQVWFFGEEPQ